MLSEHEIRVLVAAYDMLAADFEPRDAVCYLEGVAVLTADEADVIKDKPTKLERLRELLRVYKRRATDLSPLIGYFEYEGQKHISMFLREHVENTDYRVVRGPDVAPQFAKEKRMRKLMMGQVPAARNHVKRPAEMEKLAALLRTRSKLDSFFVVVHGMAGCGKTGLVSATLAESEDLIGIYFDSVCFLRDSRNRPDQTKFLYTDLLLMLREDLSVTIPSVSQLSSVALIKQINDALIDRPNVLIVLDDVTQVDTVRLADQLGLRVLATTRNADIFGAATSSVDFITLGGLTRSETEELLAKGGITGGEGCVKANKAISEAFETSSGNPAVLGKMSKLSSGKHAWLLEYSNRLRSKGPSWVNCISSYEHDDVYSTLNNTVTSLEESDRDALACAVVMPPMVWIPVEVWMTVIPVDVCGTSDGSSEAREQLSRLSRRGAWLDESEDADAYRMTSLVSSYLQETVDLETVKILTRKIKASLADLTSVEPPSPASALIMQFFSDHSAWFTELKNK